MSEVPKPAPDPLPPLDGVGITPEPEPDLSTRSEILGEEPPPATAADPLKDLPVVLTEQNTPTDADRDVPTLFIRAFLLVAGAMIVSAIVAAIIPIAPADDPDVFDRQLGVQLLFAFEIACVALLTRYVPRFSRKLIGFLLAFFAAINGVSFTVFIHWISQPALATAFLLIGISFAATALLARWRNIDLTSLRGLFLLFGTGTVLIATVTYGLNLPGEWGGAAYCGFMLFAGLACFFMEDISDLATEFDDDRTRWKAALCGALIMYLNFVNLLLLAARLVVMGISQWNDDSDEAMARRRLRSW